MSYHETSVKMAEDHIKQEALVATLRKIQASLATQNRALLAAIDHLREDICQGAAAQDGDLDLAIGEAEALIGVPQAETKTMKAAE